VTTDLEKKRAPRANLSPKALEHARAFLSALFMGLRTAQIHDTTNTAFQKAVDSVHRAAEALFASTNGFQVQFVEESCFLNGVRLRFEGGAYQAMRALRNLLESQELGGITMQAHPTQQSVRTLILLFAKSIHGEERVTREDVQRAQIGILGVQRFSDGSEGFRVDRRVFAVQSYAKLILALKEQFERAQTAAECNWTTSTPPPRLRVVRVIQDLVELCGDRADFVLRLALNATGAEPAELYGANTCLLSLALGHALGIARQDLVDLGVAALFHPVGFRVAGDSTTIELGHVHASLARMLQESGVGRSGHLRSLIVAECLVDPDPDRAVHPYSRIVRVAAHFVSRVVGYPSVDPTEPMDALAALLEDPHRHLDPRLADLLINVLRAYPEGTEVVLDSGKSGLVMSHDGGTRWDRPLVRAVDDDEARPLDLMSQADGRFVDRIAGTIAFLGKKGAAMRMLDVIPQVLPEELLEVPDALVTPVEVDEAKEEAKEEEHPKTLDPEIKPRQRERVRIGNIKRPPPPQKQTVVTPAELDQPSFGDVTDKQAVPIDFDLELPDLDDDDSGELEFGDTTQRTPDVDFGEVE
jgi:hypothetical protein